VRWRWALPCALVSALLVFTLAWMVESPAWMPPAAPLLLGGLPSAAWAGVRQRSWSGAVLTAFGWVAATIPAAALSSVWW
jgi:hypothetical protein